MRRDMQRIVSKVRCEGRGIERRDDAQAQVVVASSWASSGVARTSVRALARVQSSVGVPGKGRGLKSAPHERTLAYFW